MTEKRKGMTAPEAKRMAKAIAKDDVIGNAPDQPNARCNKCREPLRASHSILLAIRAGVCDHSGCGGQFVEIVK